MKPLYEQVELPLCRVLAEMTRLGVAVDRPALVAFGKMLTERISVVEQQIYDLAGQSFNINSPKQLGEILFEQMQLPSGKKTKTGWSTSAEVLERLKHYHPIIPLILEFRMLTKLNSTYAEGLLKVIARDRENPYHFPEYCDRDRPAFLHRSQFTEYPDTDRAWQRVAEDVCAPARLGAGGR